MQRACAICQAPFQVPPSSKKITCSRDCSHEQKRRSHQGKHYTGWSKASKTALAARGQTPNLLLGTPAARQSPIAGPFETNQEAKLWEVRDGNTGAVYHIRNLRKWCREHADLFDPDPWHLAYAGLRQVQASLIGRRKRPVSQWKGWTLARPAVMPPANAPPTTNTP